MKLFGTLQTVEESSRQQKGNPQYYCGSNSVLVQLLAMISPDVLKHQPEAGLVRPADAILTEIKSTKIDNPCWPAIQQLVELACRHRLKTPGDISEDKKHNAAKAFDELYGQGTGRLLVDLVLDRWFNGTAAEAPQSSSQTYVIVYNIKTHLFRLHVELFEHHENDKGLIVPDPTRQGLISFQEKNSDDVTVLDSVNAMWELAGIGSRFHACWWLESLSPNDCPAAIKDRSLEAAFLSALLSAAASFHARYRGTTQRDWLLDPAMAASASVTNSNKISGTWWTASDPDAFLETLEVGPVGGLEKKRTELVNVLQDQPHLLLACAASEPDDQYGEVPEEQRRFTPFKRRLAQGYVLSNQMQELFESLLSTSTLQRALAQNSEELWKDLWEGDTWRYPASVEQPTAVDDFKTGDLEREE